MRYGRGSAPTWVTALRLAEKWRMSPLDVMRMPGALKWANRQATLDRVDSRIDKIERQRSKK